MHARRWHEYCTAEIPKEPPPLTKQQWKDLVDSERRIHTERLRRWLEDLYVETAEVTVITTKMTETVHANFNGKPGAKQILGLTGPNVIGKSTLMMRWGRTQYNEWTSSADHDKRGRPVLHPTKQSEVDLCPVVWINLKAAANINDFNVKVLEFFGLPGDGVTRNLNRRALGAAERHQARVLIVDDAHLLKTDWKGGRDVLDHVKHINTELGDIGATLILVGADLDDGDLFNDPQIAGRLTPQRLTCYDIDSVDGMRTWQGIVRQIEDTVLPHLPAGKPGMLYTQLAGELYFRSQGYLGDLTELIRGATFEASNDGTHRIIKRHLDSVVLSERAENERRRPTRAGTKTKAPVSSPTNGAA